MAEGLPADQILTSVLERSGYLEALQASEDPQDQTRLENLVELVAVAREFVAGAVPGEAPESLTEQLLGWDPATGVVDRAGRPGPRGSGPRPDHRPGVRPFDGLRRALGAGAPEPDPSLGAFLERVALVADSDQIPTQDRRRAPAWSR